MPQRERFPQPLQCQGLLCWRRERLDREPWRVAWYPGSEKRADAFKKAVGGVEELGQGLGQGLGSGESASAPSAYSPWLFKAGLSPEEVSPGHIPTAHRQLGSCGCSRAVSAYSSRSGRGASVQRAAVQAAASPSGTAPHMVPAEQAVSVTSLWAQTWAVLRASQCGMVTFVGTLPHQAWPWQPTKVPLPAGARGLCQR